MSTITYFEKELYPPKYEDGKSDKTQASYILDITNSNWFGDNHQVYLRITDKHGKELTLHLTKDDAFELAEAIEGAASSIGYDNR